MVASIVALYVTAWGQDTLWTRTYGGTVDDYGMFVRQTTDGGFIFLGEVESFGAGDRDIWLLKGDSGGDTVWTRTYGGVGREYGYSIELTDDGGYIIGGSTSSYGAGLMDVYLVKTDSIGDTLWTRYYGGGETELGCYAEETDDGGYIFVGYTASFGSGSSDIYLLKTDSQGDTIWTRTYGGIGVDIAWRCQQTDDGGYIIAGETDSYGAGDRDVYLLKVDAVGDTVWTRAYGGTDSDGACYVEQTSDGDYIITGYTASLGAGGDDFFLLKVNSAGNIQWYRTYGGSGDDVAWPVRQTSDGGYIVSGQTTSFGAGDWDVYMVRTDAAGHLIWSQTYGGPAREYGWSIDLASDGGYIVNGFTESFGAGGIDLYFLRIEDEITTCCDVNMAPDAYPIEVSPGGSFGLTGIIGDPTLDPIVTDVWVGVRFYGFIPLYSFLNIPLNSGQYMNAHMVQNVPVSAPAGVYEYVAYCGDLDSWLVCDSAVFEFTVTGEPLESGAVEWILKGGWVEGNMITEMPRETALSGAFPNPFNTTTTISFDMHKSGYATLNIYNLLGQKMETLITGQMPAGRHNVQWDASGCSSGIYFCRLTAGDRIFTKRMTLIK